jgi:hypothetical protein
MMKTDATIRMSSQVGKHRLWGGLAMVGALCYLIVGVMLATLGSEVDPRIELLSLLWALGCICGLLGIATLGVTGNHFLGRIAVGWTIVAYAVAAVDAFIISIGIYTTESSLLYSISRLGTLVGMLLVGIAVLLTRRWTGWRKFSPFAIPLAIPLAILFGVITATTPTIEIFVALAWFIIGYAIWSATVE